MTLLKHKENYFNKIPIVSGIINFLKGRKFSDESFKKILEATPDAIVMINQEGKIIFVNEQTEKLFGYTKSELIDQLVEILIPESYRNRHPDHRKNFFKEPRSRPMGNGMELFGLRKNKNIFPIEISLSPLETIDGTVGLAAIRDITERKKSEERFKKILEATPDAIVMINQEGKINFVNEQTEKLFGYEKNELIDQFVEILIPEPYRSRHPQHRRNFFQEPKSRPMGTGMELFGLRKNKEIFPIEISLSPFDTNDGVVGLAAIRDITDRKHFEEALKEKNLELENAILAKDRFLTSMSHELRTPLNAIIGFTGTLLMKLPGPLNEEQDKQLNTVKRSAKHLLSLINDLLDLAKIDSGKVELNFEMTNCQDLISEIHSTLLPFASSKQLELQIDLPSEDLYIQTDKRSLTQIIINLVNNAIKFTEKGSIIIKVIKEQREEKPVAIIQIIDTGQGIKKEDQEKLFQAFQQVSTPGKRLEGTGLGLHLSQKLAHLLKGTIKLESQFDKGSIFSIELPIQG